MTLIISRLLEFLKGLRLWIIVLPWETAIVVRVGRRTRKLESGIHLCTPILDKVYTQNKRLRVVNVPTQTLSSKNGKTFVVGGTLSYRIIDLEVLLNCLQQPEDGLNEIVQERVAQYITSIDDPSVEGLTSKVNNDLNVLSYGLTELRYYVTDYAHVRTLRLIMDQRYAAYGDRVQLEPIVNSN